MVASLSKYVFNVIGLASLPMRMRVEAAS